MLVYFLLDSSPEAEDCLKDLTGMQAGAGPDTEPLSESDMEYEAPNDGDYHSLADPEDGSIVHVHKDLLKRLEGEVDCEIARVKREQKQSQTRKATKRGLTLSCRLCPFFANTSDHRFRSVLNHLSKHHAKTKTETETGIHLGTGLYVASGTKQLRLIRALYDSDAMRADKKNDYLQRCAQLLRDLFQQPQSQCWLGIDRGIILVLGTAGPYYVARDSVRTMAYLRRGTRSFYYTQGFTNTVFNDMLLCCPRMKTIRAWAVRRASEAGNPLWHLYPTEVEAFFFLHACAWTLIRADVLEK